MQEAIEQAPRSGRIEGRQAMQTPEDVQAMLKPAVPFCWGVKHVAINGVDQLVTSRSKCCGATLAA
jgi:hypothetical protein